MPQIVNSLPWPSGLRQQRVGRRTALGMLTGAGGAALLAACGKGKGRSSNGSAAATGVTAQKPVAGGALRVAHHDFIDFDPTGKPSSNQEAISWAYDSFLAFKTGPGTGFWDVSVQPNLAERWETPDTHTYIFHLQKGTKFIDVPPVNGRELTAEDAKWSMEYISRTGAIAQNKKLAGSIINYFYAGLDQIETPDNYTVVVKFTAPFAPFLNYAAWNWNAALAHEVYDQYGSFSQHLGGTGPFVLDTNASKPSERWVFPKNSAYFRKGQPYLDQVEALVIDDSPSVFAAFQTKQIDLINAIQVAGIGHSQLQKAVPNAGIISYLNSAENLSMGTDKPPLNDARVRKALSLCVDRDEFLKSFSEGKGQWAPAAGIPGLFTDDEIRQMLKPNPDQARQLLSAAGFPNGIDLELIYPGTSYGQQFINEIQLLQAQAKKGNISIALKNVDKATETIRQKEGSYQLNLVPKIVVGADLDGLLFAGYQSTSGANYGHIRDPKLDQMLVAQRQELDPAKRKQLLRDAVKYINEVPWSIGMYFGTVYSFTQPYIKNYYPSFALPGTNATQVWREK